EVTLHVGNKAVTFNLDQTSRYSANYDDVSINQIDVINVACEEYSQKVLGFSETDAFLAIEDEPISPEINDSYYDSEGDILLIEDFFNDDPSSPPLLPQEIKVVEPKNKKSSIDEPPESASLRVMQVGDSSGRESFFHTDNGMRFVLALRSAKAKHSSILKKSHGMRNLSGSPSFLGNLLRRTAEQYSFNGVLSNSNNFSLLVNKLLMVEANLGMRMRASAKLMLKFKSWKIWKKFSIWFLAFSRSFWSLSLDGYEIDGFGLGFRALRELQLAQQR
nr:reverse transcriptase domain-containing protein [Tanacetum cinerariifolium]